MSDIDEAVRNGWLHKDAEDEIKRLRAERDAQRARANANEMCAAAVVEIRRVCAEIMGGNMAFVDDDFARCLLTLRDERDALAKENAALRTLLAECSSADPDDDERDDNPYCDCGNIPSEEEDAFNRCSACGKRLDP